jgi:hypothetical protein
MKFKAAKNSVLGSQTMEPHERIAVETEIDHAKWLVWHGKGRRSASRIKALDATLLAKEGYEHSTLYCKRHLKAACTDSWIVSKVVPTK